MRGDRTTDTSPPVETEDSKKTSKQKGERRELEKRHRKKSRAATRLAGCSVSVGRWTQHREVEEEEEIEKKQQRPVCPSKGRGGVYTASGGAVSVERGKEKKEKEVGGKNEENRLVTKKKKHRWRKKEEPSSRVVQR